MQYNSQSLRAYKALFTEQINQVVKMLREDIPLLHRLALEALIVVDVHNRDVLTQLVLSEVTKEDDFEWVTKVNITSNDLTHFR